MKQNKFGLPPEYQKQPEYFDALNVHDDTDKKNSVIENILRKHNVHTVLDLTCGTGSQVFWLVKHGFKVIGADFSPALVEQARAKVAKEKIDVRFIDGDMRTLKVGQFDAVITIFNAVGHLTKDEFKVAMKNIYSNLKDGGLYVFDIFNLSAMTDVAIDNFAMDWRKKVDADQIDVMQHSTIDRVSGQLTSYNNYTIQKGVSKPKKFKNKFILQVYTASELKEMLVTSGFEVVDLYGMDGSIFREDTTISILMVAKKKKA